MKHLATAAALAGAAALSACQSSGGLDPTTQATVTVAYNTICVGSPGNPPVMNALALYAPQMNKAQASVYASAQTMCSFGVPTNAFSAAADALVVASAIQTNFPNIKIGLK
jgi:hypothetical protein